MNEQRVIILGTKTSGNSIGQLLCSANNQVKIIENCDLAVTSDFIDIVKTVLVIDSALLPMFSDKQQFALKHNSPILFFNSTESECLQSTTETFSCITVPDGAKELMQYIQFATFKVNYQQKIDKQNTQLTKAISCVGETLVYVDNDMRILDINGPENEFISGQKDRAIGQQIGQVLTASRTSTAIQFEQFIQAAIKTNAVTKIQPTAFTIATGEQLLFDGLIGPFNSGEGQQDRQGAVLILRKMDVINSIPKELELNGEPGHEIGSRTGCILLINPDDFSQINKQYGWQQGDQILQEIENRLQKILRATDFSTRYSGAFFLVVLNDINNLQAKNIINKLQRALNDERYLQSEAKLAFSFGFALNNTSLDFSLLELFYFANTSLSKAIEQGGNQVQQWQQPTILQQIGNFDRLYGGFLNQGNINYRQMLTLWELLNRIDATHDLISFVKQLNPILVSSLGLNSSSFYKVDKMKVKWIHSGGNQQIKVGEPSKLTEVQSAFVLTSAAKNNDFPSIEVVQQESVFSILLVVSINDSTSILLKLDGENFALPSLDNQNLLRKLADFIRVNLQRIELDYAIKQSSDKDLLANNGSDFWYASKEMESLMHEVSMVACTDATVLITGESGTGKEILAKQIHDLSERSKKPFIIFDCSTIVTNLLESELFGHRKGAFTGADKEVDGCIKQAEGGTLFLDEVGELSLETQMKLLRFIQEKQYSAVGSATYKIADVRIISATNVNLLEQMKTGKFREDLYYRLNVFNVKTHPLRKRQDDILLLANEFLKIYARQYKKNISAFELTAQIALTEYQWPGNVRELKNIVHKAIILCDQSQVICSHLGLYPQNTAQLAFDVPALLGSTNAAETYSNHLAVTPSAIEKANSASKNIDSLCENVIKDKFEQLILTFIKQGFDNSSGLFLIIEAKLYQQALNSSNFITLQAAKRLNISESTFRRRWKILSQSASELSTIQVDMVEDVVATVMQLQTLRSKPLLIKDELIYNFIKLNIASKICAQILGVTVATYRKLVKDGNLSY